MSEAMAEKNDDSRAIVTATGSDRRVTDVAIQEQTGINPMWSELLVDGTRDGLWIARTATAFSIETAKFWTKFGLQIGRRATQLGVGIPAMIADASNGDPRFHRGQGTATSAAMYSVNALFDAIDMVTIGSINLGGKVADVSLQAASSSFGFFQGELAQCLASIARLLHRNWTYKDERLPPGGIPPYSALQVMQALTAWISIQQVTYKAADQRVYSGLIRLEPKGLRSQVEAVWAEQKRERQSEHAPLAAVQDPTVTDEMKMPGDGGDIVSAVIGQAHPQHSSDGNELGDARALTPAEAVVAFARYSRLCLAVYGGAALRLWGIDVPYGDDVRDKTFQAAAASDSVVTQILVNASKVDRESDQSTVEESDDPTYTPGYAETIFDSETAAEAIETEAPPTLIDLFSGRHDDDVFHRYTGLEPRMVSTGSYPESEHNVEPEIPFKPKYYVVTDHDAGKVILVLRGTLSLGDAAADLTCDSIPFVNVDAFNPPPYRSAKIVPNRSPARGEFHDDDTAMLVHEGMYLTALAIGGRVDAPVHQAIAKALGENPGYGLDLIGHSLGGGVSALLALLWVGIPSGPSTTPLSGRTSVSSGLPSGRRVRAYCFAPPAVMSAPLARRCSTFINGWANSYDAVPRLSLGSILDIRNACAWLLYEQKQSKSPSAGTDTSVDSAANAVADEVAASLQIQNQETRSQQTQAPLQRNRQAPFDLSTIIRQAASHSVASSVNEQDRSILHPTSLFNRFTRSWGSSAEDAARSRAHTEEAFWSLRESLEAKMKHVELYPPGDIFLTMADGGLFWLDDKDKHGKGARDTVFGQIEFRGGFLQSHLAHVYHAVLADFLNNTK